MNDWETSLVSSSGKFPAPGPNVPIDIALNTLQSALSAAIESSRIREDGRTKRSMILAQKEVEIAKIEMANTRAMENDARRHEFRMTLTNTICKLLLDNARNLTPDVKEACQIALQTLRENS